MFFFSRMNKFLSSLFSIKKKHRIARETCAFNHQTRYSSTRVHWILFWGLFEAPGKQKLKRNCSPWPDWLISSSDVRDGPGSSEHWKRAKPLASSSVAVIQELFNDSESECCKYGITSFSIWLNSFLTSRFFVRLVLCFKGGGGGGAGGTHTSLELSSLDSTEWFLLLFLWLSSSSPISPLISKDLAVLKNEDSRLSSILTSP